MNPEIERVRNEIEREIALNLSKVGLFFRIFSRAKSENSIDAKLSKNSRRAEGKKIQDLIGVRIVCYFRQDEKLVEEILKKLFELDNQSVSAQTADIFSPTRNNFVFKIKESHRLSISHPLIDQTFEAQIRTVFSEGWHEVEHDIRYKHQELWSDTNSNRELNSVYATLEMCDWGIERIMADMAYAGYKSKNVISMLTGKFMLRFAQSDIPKELMEIVSDNEILKAIYKSDRTEVIRKIWSTRSAFPITPQLLVYICNHFNIKDQRISSITPAPLLEILKESTPLRSD